MFTGSCQCRTIHLEADTVLPIGLNCYCSICRKISGAPFAATVMIERACFRIVSGAEHLRVHNASPEFERRHCGRCFSPIVGDTVGYPEWPLFVPATALEDAALAGVSFHHIWVDSMVPWHQIKDSEPRFAEAPPYLATPSAPDLTPFLARSR